MEYLACIHPYVLVVVYIAIVVNFQHQFLDLKAVLVKCMYGLLCAVVMVAAIIVPKVDTNKYLLWVVMVDMFVVVILQDVGTQAAWA